MLNTASLKQPKVIVPATVVTVVATVLLPFLIHLLPSIGNVPMGARLLPLFIAPFVAVVLFHPAVSLVASLVTPLLNHLLTGRPTLEVTALLTVELVIFSLSAALLYRRWPEFWGNAPLSYIVARVGSLIILSLVPLLPVSPWASLVGSLQVALPGLLLLLLLNALVVRIRQA